MTPKAKPAGTRSLCTQLDLASDTLSVDRIHIQDFTEYDSENKPVIKRPYALIEYDEGINWESFSGGSRTFRLPHGRMKVIFESVVSTENRQSPADALFEHTNKVDAVMEDIRELPAADEDLAIEDVTVVERPFRADEAERRGDEDFFQTIFSVEF